MSAWFQYQVRAEPLDTTAGVPTLDRWEPTFPAYIVRRVAPDGSFATLQVEMLATDPDISSWLGCAPATLSRSVVLTALQQAWAANLDPLPNAPAPELSWLGHYPDWHLYRRVAEFPSLVLPLAAELPRLPVPSPAFSADILEQSSGTYYALLVDEFDRPISPSVLSSLTLTLYTIRADRTIRYINNRVQQDGLNANGVTLSGVQLRADGQSYNLKWAVQPGDTTLSDTTLPSERHIALFTYQWPTGKVGRHEIVINVKNLVEV